MIVKESVNEIKRQIDRDCIRLAMQDCQTRVLSEFYQAVFITLQEEGFSLEQCYEGLIGFIVQQPAIAKTVFEAEEAMRKLAKECLEDAKKQQ